MRQACHQITGYIIVVVKRWRDANIQFPVYILRAVRESAREANGSFRRADMGIREAGVAYRYIELAHYAGECPESDKYISKTFKILRDLQLEDGSARGVEFDELWRARYYC